METPSDTPEAENTIAAARAARPDLDLLRPGKQRDRLAADYPELRHRIAPHQPIGASTTREDANTIAARPASTIDWATPLRPAFPPDPKWHAGPMPIDHVIINGTTIDGTQFEMGSLQHDVNTGTVTIKFIDVQDLTIVYKHMLGEEQS